MLLIRNLEYLIIWTRTTFLIIIYEMKHLWSHACKELNNCTRTASGNFDGWHSLFFIFIMSLLYYSSIYPFTYFIKHIAFSIIIPNQISPIFCFGVFSIPYSLKHNTLMRCNALVLVSLVDALISTIPLK